MASAAVKGVLLLSSKTGVVLFAKSYVHNYGLNLNATKDGGESSSSGSSSGRDPKYEAMFLSNFLCALYGNVKNLLAPADAAMEDETEAGEEQKKRDHVPFQPTERLIHAFDTGEVTLYFDQDVETDMMAVVSLGRGSSYGALGRWLVERVLRAFLEQFSEQLRGGDGQQMSTRRFRRFGDTLRDVLQDVPTFWAGEIMRRLRQQQQCCAQWVYVLHASSFAQSMEPAATPAAPPPPRPPKLRKHPYSLPEPRRRWWQRAPKQEPLAALVGTSKRYCMSARVCACVRRRMRRLEDGGKQPL